NNPAQSPPISSPAIRQASHVQPNHQAPTQPMPGNGPQEIIVIMRDRNSRENARVLQLHQPSARLVQMMESEARR
ncbi:MAG: hypothetical protein AAFP69_20135, partial [Planctomycetota bacterium]